MSRRFDPVVWGRAFLAAGGKMYPTPEGKLLVSVSFDPFNAEAMALVRAVPKRRERAVREAAYREGWV